MSATAVRTSRPHGGTPPNRSLEQRLDALQRANEIRSHRSHVKRDLAAGRVSLAEVLDDPEFASAKVYDVLLAMRKVGRVKAGRAMHECKISLAKTCGGITDRQRALLADELAKRGL